MTNDGLDGDERPRKLPFSRWIPLLTGAAFGLLARGAFSGWLIGDEQLPDVMTFSFLFGTPAAVGAITVFMAERVERKPWSYCVTAPWSSVFVFVAGTAIALIEGAICIAMALPIFLALGSVGGVAAGIAVRLLNRPTGGMQVVALLPFAMAGIEAGVPTVDRYGLVESSMEIAAPAATVWQYINGITDIQSNEVSNTWAQRIGAPGALEGITSETPTGRVRVSRWEKGVEFREIITDWQPPHHMRWTYELDADSFPPGALDDHVVIGGRYFDLLSTSYDLRPTAAGTRITIQTRYRVTTGFNWYADAIAQFVLRDFQDKMLLMYQARSENSTRASHSSAAVGG